MEITVKSDRRISAGNMAILGAVLVLTTAEWHLYSWYEAVAPYGTIIASIGLITALFCYVDIREMLKDPAFLLMCAADVIALVNLFIVGSGKGAILTVADFLLILYLSNKIKLSGKQVIISVCYLGFFFLFTMCFYLWIKSTKAVVLKGLFILDKVSGFIFSSKRLYFP